MKVRNWKKFQHFKDRRPPWIKLHRGLLDQRDISLISDRSFRVLIGLWLVASDDDAMEGNLPDDLEEIAFRLRLPKADLAVALRELEGFIEGVDIKLISDRYQTDITGKEPQENQAVSDNDIKLISTRYQVDHPEERRGETEKRTEERYTTDLPENGTVVMFDHLAVVPTTPSSAKPKPPEYSPEFEEAWAIYPKRAGDNPKRRAFQAWKARLKEGATPTELYDGTVRYAVWVSATGKLNTELVKQAATFYGPDKPYLEAWTPPAVGSKGGPKPEWAKVPFDDDQLWLWAKQHGYSGPGQMTYRDYRLSLQRQVEQRIKQQGAE